MNILENISKIKSLNIKILQEKKGKGIIVRNTTSKKGYIIFARNFYGKECKKIDLLTKSIKGKKPSLKILSNKFKIIHSIEENGEILSNIENKKIFLGLVIYPNSESVIKKINISDVNIEDTVTGKFTGDILLLTPGYPTDNDMYNCAFIHPRVQAYIDAGYKVDVALVNENYINKTVINTFEGVNIVKTGYNEIRKLLQIKKYNKILIHFFNEKYAQILDASDISSTNIYIFVHGADTMYWDWGKMACGYFEPQAMITPELKALFMERDAVIKKYNEMSNVKWVFVAEFTKSNSERLLNIKFKNSCVIPCNIDDKAFKYEIKTEEKRKKICIIRKFHNINTYAIDIDVRVILELSKRPFFSDLEFSIYGDGNMHDILLNPIKKFKNVHIYKKFLNHEEMGRMYRNHGIALFATRYDSQAVASLEAAKTGCVVLTSKNVGVTQFINENIGTYCETENFVEYADLIEQMYYNPKLFLEKSKKMHESIEKNCGYDKTIAKDLELLQEPNVDQKRKYKKADKNPLLTIAVPSYNVEKYLKHGILSLINNSLSHKIEVLIIDDGSRDNTSKIATELQKLTTIENKSIVKLISKENGGHGSTINTGIQEAKGKYFRLMDGDDYFIETEFVKLLQILQQENSDIILTNYIADYSIDAFKEVIKDYDFMVPGIKYDLDFMNYNGYGFKNWGPLLSTATYKTENLKKSNFIIDKKCFYVDMEYNYMGYVNSQNVVYYPLNIYNYYLGRAGQSNSKDGYKKNWFDHETVCLRLVKEFEKDKDKLSEGKKDYLLNRIIIPMCKSQYDIVMEYFNTRKQFISFDNKLKKYPYFYYMDSIAGKRAKLHRITKGYLIKFDKIIKYVIKIIKNGGV